MCSYRWHQGFASIVFWQATTVALIAIRVAQLLVTPSISANRSTIMSRPLSWAARDEPGSQLALAHNLGVDRTVMTYLLDSLAEAGLVECRPGPLHRAGGAQCRPAGE